MRGLRMEGEVLISEHHNDPCRPHMSTFSHSEMSGHMVQAYRDSLFVVSG